MQFSVARASALAFLVIITSTSWGQSAYAPLNEDYYHWIDRYEVKRGRLSSELFTTVKPYQRADIAAFVDSLDEKGAFSSDVDLFNRAYLRNDSWEWAAKAESDSKRPFLRHFYRKKSDFYHVSTADFDLHVNPVLYLSAGSDSRLDDRLFINTRGAELRGSIDGKLGFYTFLAENQAILPAHARDFVSDFGVVPHEGFWKPYKEGPGVDFLHARGYITFNATRHIGIQFGHDRFFIGNGNRSLIWSDFAPPSLFLKTNVKIWKINYLFMIHQMVANASPIRNRSAYPNKFVAFHHLSVNIGKKLNVGLFESVVFSADDTLGADKFRLDYLNPIIFYRAIEQQNGSSDNVILGADFKWNVLPRFSIYGQFVLDELVIDNLREQNGWWANKFGIQAGGKYVDAFGISNLDLQGEVNVVRPFTYSHNSNYGNYSSYRQSLAHPLGANFSEITGILRYQPAPRVYLTGKISMMETGRDSVANVSWGGNILRRNTLRIQEYGNTLAQGASNTIYFGTFTASYQWKHNFFIDASVVIRKSESVLARYNNNATIATLAVRWNVPQRLHEF